ncbi:MAG: nucleoside diphosphate kinase regulator [Phycisphaerae bacterium]|nr:nucleoside diphosphate kinase regulator [Phycisphaerae bacterium]
MAAKKIQVTQVDHERLTRLIDSTRNVSTQDQAFLDKLRTELVRARIISSKRVKPDVVTMNSTIKLRDLDNGELHEYQLVYPQDADPENNKLSILAPVGTALLGFSVGDTVEWPVPAGLRHLKIEEIIYQPESAGDYTL